MKNVLVKTTPAFEQKAKKLLTLEALEALFDHLEKHSDEGDLIPGTSGVRTIRWKTGKDNKGKSGGVRILYHYSKDILVLLISLYGKSEKGNITQAEKNALKKAVPILVSKYREDL